MHGHACRKFVCLLYEGLRRLNNETIFTILFLFLPDLFRCPHFGVTLRHDATSYAKKQSHRWIPLEILVPTVQFTKFSRPVNPDAGSCKQVVFFVLNFRNYYQYLLDEIFNKSSQLPTLVSRYCCCEKVFAPLFKLKYCLRPIFSEKSDRPIIFIQKSLRPFLSRKSSLPLLLFFLKKSSLLFTHFFFGNSIFNLSLELLTKFRKMSLKVAQQLLSFTVDFYTFSGNQLFLNRVAYKREGFLVEIL